ncbi:hypothetical protein CRG98_029997 [Punica granatum]|uniref:Uncharacterized protein n=1 Tax=Punica granatum TaxID=22663 RepID=A0A2I0J026_PUNGR|nr:hypothetical protein CRG98_029997 [Punica granatum]
MVTMSIDELTSLLMGHEERRSYTTTREQSQQLTPAPLSGILGPPPAEVHYTDSRGRIDYRGNNYGGKAKNRGKGKGIGQGSAYGGHGLGGNPRSPSYGGHGGTRGQGGQGRPLSIPNPNFAGNYRGGQGSFGRNGSGYNINPARDTRTIQPGFSSQPGTFNSMGSTQIGPFHMPGGPASASSPVAASVVCQNCNRPGHTAPFCQFNYFSGVQTNIAKASSQGLHDLDWYMDSGKHASQPQAHLSTSVSSTI